VDAAPRVAWDEARAESPPERDRGATQCSLIARHGFQNVFFQSDKILQVSRQNGTVGARIRSAINHLALHIMKTIIAFIGILAASSLPAQVNNSTANPGAAGAQQSSAIVSTITFSLPKGFQQGSIIQVNVNQGAALESGKYSIAVCQLPWLGLRLQKHGKVPEPLVWINLLAVPYTFAEAH
jgi:hypothetical protein